MTNILSNIYSYPRLTLVLHEELY